MRLLVTGAGGLLGGRLAQILSERFSVVAGHRTGPPPPGLESAHLELGSGAPLDGILGPLRPDAVLHSAAIADPDLCEADPGLARRVNTEAATAVAAWCGARGVPLVALSTDLVFGGDRAPYAEKDPPCPILVYGRTKADAEAAVLARHPGAAIARVALVVGAGHGARRTASEAIAAALVEGRPARLYTDQFRTPIDARSVADAVGRLVDQGRAGVFHLGGAERVSRFELGQRLASALSLPETLLVRVTAQEAPQKAQRPADVSLQSAETRTLLGWSPRPLREALLEGR